MPSEELRKHAEDVISLLGDDTKTPVNADDIQGQLERFLEYGVPLAQAKQTLLKKYGTSSTISTQAIEPTKITDLQPHMKSVKIIAQIVSINPKDITVKGEPRQIYYGIIRDDTGSASFTSWHDMQVDRGDVVEIANAYTNEWQGAVQVNIGNRTQVEKKDNDALPKETFEPTKCTIDQVHFGMGSLDMKLYILSIDKKEIETDGNKKTMYTGVFGDQTGKIPFTAWHDFKLKEQDTITLVGGSVRSWNGVPQITFDETATVTKEKKEKLSIDAIPQRTLRMYELEEQGGMFDVSIEGRVIEIQQGSGFFLRCPTCKRTLFDGNCQEHGSVEGTPDLRIRCIIDDGTGSVNALFNRELSEKILGKTIDDCKERDPARLMDDMKETLFSHLFSLTGNARRDRFGIIFRVTAVEQEQRDLETDAKKLMETMEQGGVDA